MWNLGGDVRMGVMGSVSLNCQVRSFCNDSPHLDDSLLLSLLLFDLLSYLIFFPPHTCSLCLLNVFSFIVLQRLFISSTFGIIMDEQKLGLPPTFSLLRPTTTFQQMSRFNSQQRLHLCLICQPLHAHTALSIPTLMPASMS